MLCQYNATVSRLSVRPTVRDVQVCFPHRVEYFENNFTDPNMGDLVRSCHGVRFFNIQYLYSLYLLPLLQN